MLKFDKMHGCGNDFILIDGVNTKLERFDFVKLAPRLCDRNFGIGADGIILVLPSEKADFAMLIINSDGSIPEMCGNGIRCLAKFVYDNDLTKKDVLSIDTGAGIRIVELVFDDNKLVTGVEVDMGEPLLKRSQIPAVGPENPCVVNEELEIGELVLSTTLVSMGNPHCVIYETGKEQYDLLELGPQVETHIRFPNRTNFEIVRVINPREIVVRVWERGAGSTMACGTGACAAVVAGVLGKRNERKVLVHLPGGHLQIEWQEEDNHVIMTGPAEKVFTGEIKI